MLIRKAMPSDTSALGELHVRTWQEGYRGLLSEEVLASLSIEGRTQTWETILTQHPEVIVLVAEDTEKLVGFTSAGPLQKNPQANPLQAELGAIYLRESYWGAGIGSQLMQQIEAELKNHGFTTVVLWVFTDNERASDFYAYKGWSKTGQTDTHGSGLSLSQWAKELQ